MPQNKQAEQICRAWARRLQKLGPGHVAYFWLEMADRFQQEAVIEDRYTARMNQYLQTTLQQCGEAAKMPNHKAEAATIRQEALTLLAILDQKAGEH